MCQRLAKRIAELLACKLDGKQTIGRKMPAVAA
jgi:hypothetical protein